MKRDDEKQKLQSNKAGMVMKGMEVNLMADVSDCLDEYRVFKIEELEKPLITLEQKSGCNAIAPEYLVDGLVSTKMDVFSFGVVLLELISNKEAIDEEGKLLWASVDGILDGNEERKVNKVQGIDGWTSTRGVLLI
ncbi:hypothetical protein PTKIN_Ptkin14bG0096000 [Pterospermum kingtungense]